MLHFEGRPTWAGHADRLWCGAEAFALAFGRDTGKFSVQAMLGAACDAEVGTAAVADAGRGGVGEGGGPGGTHSLVASKASNAAPHHPSARLCAVLQPVVSKPPRGEANENARGRESETGSGMICSPARLVSLYAGVS